MQAFYNDPALKAQYLERVRWHRANDELVQGVYWEKRDGRYVGCAVGCLAETNDHPHEALAQQIGVPAPLLYVVDRLFEGMSAERAQAWPEAFIAAIEPGDEALLQKLDQWLLFLLVDEQDGVVRFANERGKAVIQHVAALYRRRLDGKSVTAGAWDKVKADAWAAADAAYVAAYAAAYADAWA